jgi:general secretion pathway protein E/type IV pilus assembly protein PilB
MGVEPFLVSSTVAGVLAQRLVRRLCPDCSEPDVPSRGDVPIDFPWDALRERGNKIYRAVGCPNCRGTGYRGRMGIYELLCMNEEMRDMATERTTTTVLKKAARRSGMVTLREDGWSRALEGVTTIDEVLRVTKADD